MKLKKLKYRRYFVFVLLTILALFVSRQLMGLLHEWTHSSTAWVFNLKNSPFEIDYGDCGAWFLWNADENVDYESLFSINQGTKASIIAISALIMNIFLFLLSIFMLNRETIQKRKWIYYFIFWFGVMNIGELFSYIPLRTFSETGDVGYFLRGLNISPWILFFPGTVLVGMGILYIFKKELPRYYNIMSLSSIYMRELHLIILIFFIFFWFGGKAFYYYGPNNSLSLWSLLASFLGIVFFIIFNPSLKWVKKAVKSYSN